MNGRIRQKEVIGRFRNPLARFWKGCSNQLQGTKESFKADSQRKQTVGYQWGEGSGDG